MIQTNKNITMERQKHNLLRKFNQILSYHVLSLEL